MSFFNVNLVIPLFLNSCILGFAQCNGRQHGAIRNIEVLGVVKTRWSPGRRCLVVYQGNGVVHLKAGGKYLKNFGDTNWIEQNTKYGDRNGWYSEFQVPPLPTVITVKGETYGYSGNCNLSPPSSEAEVRVRLSAGGQVETDHSSWTEPLGYKPEILSRGVLKYHRWISTTLQVTFTAAGHDHSGALIIDAFNPGRSPASIGFPAGALLTPKNHRDGGMQNLVLKEALSITVQSGMRKHVESYAFCGNKRLSSPRCNLRPTNYILSPEYLSSQIAVYRAVEPYMTLREEL